MTLSSATCDYIDRLAAGVRDRITLSSDTVGLKYADAKKCVESLNGRVEHRSGQDSEAIKTGENSFTIYVKEENIEELLHELGHVLLEWHEVKIEAEDEDKPKRVGGNTGVNSLIEEAVNYFMRMVLMPTMLFMKQVINYSYNNLCDFSALANAFGVSRYTVIRRGKELGLWP